jgi:sulfate transport system substrate-binding protein
VEEFDADVFLDTAVLHRKGLLAEKWDERLPNRSLPYYSTIVFVVRRGNPKGIHAWRDLVKAGVQVITPNPKTSGGARWAYLAAWGDARRTGGDDGAKRFVAELYQHVPVLDSGARGATTTFVERGLGDVLLAWENEAYLVLDQAKDDYEIVVPPRSILAEPPVAVVDAVAARRQTTEIARAYLEFLYTDQGQEIIARHHYRPRAAKPAPVELFSIDDLGGWAAVQRAHFADGAIFDTITTR